MKKKIEKIEKTQHVRIFTLEYVITNENCRAYVVNLCSLCLRSRTHMVHVLSITKRMKWRRYSSNSYLICDDVFKKSSMYEYRSFYRTISWNI